MSTIVEARGLKMYFPIGRTIGGKPKNCSKPSMTSVFRLRKAKPSA